MYSKLIWETLDHSLTRTARTQINYFYYYLSQDDTGIGGQVRSLPAQGCCGFNSICLLRWCGALVHALLHRGSSVDISKQQVLKSVLNKNKLQVLHPFKNNDGSEHCLGGLRTLAEDRKHYSHSGSQTNRTKNPGWDESHEHCLLSPLYRQCLSLTSSASLPSVNYPMPLPAHWTKTAYLSTESTELGNGQHPNTDYSLVRTAPASLGSPTVANAKSNV